MTATGVIISRELYEELVSLLKKSPGSIGGFLLGWEYDNRSFVECAVFPPRNPMDDSPHGKFTIDTVKIERINKFIEETCKLYPNIRLDSIVGWITGHPAEFTKLADNEKEQFTRSFSMSSVAIIIAYPQSIFKKESPQAFAYNRRMESVLLSYQGFMLTSDENDALLTLKKAFNNEFRKHFWDRAPIIIHHPIQFGSPVISKSSTDEKAAIPTAPGRSVINNIIDSTFIGLNHNPNMIHIELGEPEPQIAHVNKCVISKKLYDDVLEFARNYPRTEWGGMLIGRRINDECHVLGAVFPPQMQQTSVYCEFGGRDLIFLKNSIQELQQENPLMKDVLNVGWIHTHPNLSVFFSGRDRQTFSNWCSFDSNAIAIVIDPFDQSRLICVFNHSLSEMEYKIDEEKLLDIDRQSLGTFRESLIRQYRETNPDGLGASEAKVFLSVDLSQIKVAIATVDKTIAYSADKLQFRILDIIDNEISANPLAVFPLFMKGIVFADLGRYSEAVSYLDKALEIKKDYEDASIVRSALIKKKTELESLLSSGEEMLKQGYLDDALKSLDKALAISNRSVDALYRKGEIYTKKGMTDVAISTFHEILKLDPKNIPTWIAMGIIYKNLGRYVDALKCYSTVKEMSPERYDVLYESGVLNELMRDNQGALNCYRKCVEIDSTKLEPKDNITRVEKRIEAIKGEIEQGEGLLNEGRYADALKEFEKLHVEKYGADVVLSHLGTIYDRTGDPEKAINCYDRSLEINSRCMNAWFQKGITLKKLSRHNEAMKSFDQVLYIKSHDKESLVQKGYCTFNLRRYSESLKVFDTILAYEPQNGDAILYKTVLRYRMGDDDAMVTLQQIIKNDPKRMDAYYWVGLIYEGRSHPRIAMQYYTSTLKSIKDFTPAVEGYNRCSNAIASFSARVKEADRLFSIGEHDAALAGYKNALAIMPDEPEIFKKIGIIYELKSDLNAAAEYYTKFLDHVPRSAEVLTRKGIVFFRHGEYNNAIDCFNSALGIDPEYIEARFQKAGALQELDKADDAIKLYEELLHSESIRARALDRIALLYQKKGNLVRAKECLTKLLELEPEHKQAKEQLKTIEKELATIRGFG